MPWWAANHLLGAAWPPGGQSSRKKHAWSLLYPGLGLLILSSLPWFSLLSRAWGGAHSLLLGVVIISWGQPSPLLEGSKASPLTEKKVDFQELPWLPALEWPSPPIPTRSPVLPLPTEPAAQSRPHLPLLLWLQLMGTSALAVGLELPHLPCNFPLHPLAGGRPPCPAPAELHKFSFVLHVHLVTVNSVLGSYSHLCVPRSPHHACCSRCSADKLLGINWTLKYFIYFYWSAVHLHCCANLHCTANWLSYITIDILFFF